MFVRSFMPSGNILESCSAGASGACCSVLRKYHDGWCERGLALGVSVSGWKSQLQRAKMAWLVDELICHFSQDKCQEPQEGACAEHSLA